MTDVKRNEHMLPIANWLRDQINETLSRYDIPSDVYDTDTLIDALCVCAVDRSQAALRARLETVEKRGKVLEQGWKIADDGRIEAETRADLATHATMRCAECDCEKGGADCNWIATPTPAVKVKALVWQRNGDHHAGGYGYVIRKVGSRYTLTVRNNHGQNFDTIEAAKAAAQADYEARVMAALEPATPLNDPRVKALVEALKEAERMLKHYGSRDAGGMAQIKAALEAIASPSISALEENK